ncbi:MAG: D-alanyl-D-alanine carboxypeptidase/D-alanyl-D-alanine-endopeptidase [Thiotrichaceae bacterium]|nr:D-alanyl-D-alanine carboxypeptidase/D-alanyl-D-alanine-endopeptidase [Thiotrichaceae bacterium]
MTRRLLLIILLVIVMPVFSASDQSTKKEPVEPQPAVLMIKSQETLKELPEKIRNLLKKYKIPKENISILVQDLNTDKPLLSHNPTTPRNPASTMKLLTTYAALKVLEPNYTWRTEAWVRGTIKEGVLKGDLILKGYGDPFLVHQNYWKFVQGIREKGLHTIKGKIIIDNSFFTVGKQNRAAFDQRPLRAYNALPSALMYNFQTSRFLFRPDKKNNKIEIIPYPWIPNFNYINNVKLQKGRCKRRHYRPKFKLTDQSLTISGSYSAQCGQQFIMKVLSKPPEHAFNAFRDFWRNTGGKLQAKMKIGKVRKGDTRFHIYYSNSLSEQIRKINKWSNNVMTRQLLLTLGAKAKGRPGTMVKGRAAIFDALNEVGINTQKMVIDNGSGLSRIARVSAQQHASLLIRAWRDKFMPEFLSSLSLSGLDGTLVNRFRNDDMRGRSHMKTGSLNNVRSIAGYMLNRKGRWMVVVMHHNGAKASSGRGAKIQNTLLQWVFEQ